MAPTVSHAVLVFSKLLVYVLIILQPGQAADTIVPSEPIYVGKTLMSASQVYELGFFQPINSSRRYMGIWYKTIPGTILWVANRENPLSASDESARLMLGDDGNLKILDGNQLTVWSTNVSVHLNSSVAVLSDAGDLILKDSTSGLAAWESFDHFCDVFLMTMQSELNTKTGEQQLLSSWRSENDPGVGHFTSGLLPQAPVQVVVWNGSAIYWRSGPWNGVRFVGIPDIDAGYLDGWSIRQNEATGIIYFSVNQYDQGITRVMKLFPEGALKIMNWEGDHWNITWLAPQNQCDVYGMCGPFGVCNANESPICSCPRGFIPTSAEEWSNGNWTNGCTRRLELQCSRNASTTLTLANDGFWKLSRMKVPDNYRYLPSGKDNQGCQEECLSNCSCAAYAYVDGIGCLLWTGDLVDVQEFSFSGEDLFVRLDHSELGKSKKVTIIISIVSVLVVVILCVLIIFAVHRIRNKQQRERRKGIMWQFFLRDAMDGSSDMHQELKWKNILQDELTTFEFEDIVTATNGFSHTNKLGQGGFGAVFRGKLHNGQEIAVKRLSGHSGQGLDEFFNEILLISKLQHRNLVRILGCSIKGKKLIVYEYLPNRSLDAFLFGEFGHFLIHLFFNGVIVTDVTEQKINKQGQRFIVDHQKLLHLHRREEYL